MVQIPNVTMRVAISLLTHGVCFMRFNCCAKTEKLNNAGKFPSPNIAIRPAECQGLAATNDQLNVLYIRPQGNSPHTNPSKTPCFTELTGIRLFVRGCTFDQR